MQKTKKIGLSLLILFLGGIGLVILSISDLLRPSNSELKAPIPTQYDWAIRIDASTFVKEELYTILFKSKDEQLLKQLETLFDRKWKSKGKKGQLYIDYQNDIVFYQKTESGNVFNGIIVQTIRPDKCLENITAYLQENQSAKIEDHSLIILTQTVGNKIPKQKLNELVSRFSSNEKQVFLVAKDLNRRNLLELNINKLTSIEEIKNLQIGIYSENKSLTFNGNFTAIENENEKTNTSLYSISGKGMKIYSHVIPKMVNDSILNFFKLKDLTKITGLSVDYQGVFMDDAVAGMYSQANYTPIPLLNSVLEFEKPITVAQLTANLSKELYRTEGKITFTKAVYFVKQIDEKSIFIGLNPETVKKKIQKDYFYMGGDFSSLFNLKATYFITAFFEAMSPVKSSKEFLSKTKNIEFTANKKGEKGKITGQFLFKDENQPLNEITKLMLGLGIIK